MIEEACPPSGLSVSRQAYHNIEHKLADCEQRIYKVFTDTGRTLNAREVSEILHGDQANLVFENVRARISGLRKRGLLRVDRRDFDAVTEQTVQYYRLPREGEPVPDYVPRTGIIKRLKQENASLRKEQEELIKEIVYWHGKVVEWEDFYYGPQKVA
jgi:hypothetical protein